MTTPNDPWSNPYGQPGQQGGQPQHGQPQYGDPSTGQNPSQPQYGQPQYGGPPTGPPTGPNPSQPQYGDQYGGQPQYGQPQHGQPQYGGPAPYGQYGGPMPPAQYGPGGMDRRPGGATAAAVLSYIQAGFVILAGIILMAGAGLASDIGDSFDSDTGSVTAELVLYGIIDLALGAAFIAGAVILTSRRRRNLLVIACVANLVFSLYWVIRSEDSGKALVLFFVVLPVISLALIFGGTVTTWLRTATPTR